MGGPCPGDETMSLPANPELIAMQARVGDASRLLKVLGNAQRLRVLCLLIDQEMSVGQINEQLPDLSQSALSQHLARLREEGLVQTRREAQTVWYTLEHGPTRQIIATLSTIYCAPDQAAATHKGKPARGRIRPGK
jgi:DNA-binding transcriptional ArsR family regulator